MSMTIFKGILIPFLGTSLGAACVLFMKKNLHYLVQRALTGFAAGVMVAAGVWSLLIPSMEQSAKMGRLRFVPAAVGFMLGVFFLLFLDRVIPHLHMNATEPEGAKSSFQRTTMLVLAVTLHNIPEGMAVGVVYAGWAADHHAISAAGALALSLGIAIQHTNAQIAAHHYLTIHGANILLCEVDGLPEDICNFGLGGGKGDFLLDGEAVF